MVPQGVIRYDAKNDHALSVCPGLLTSRQGQEWQVPNKADFDGFSCQNLGRTVLLAEYDSRLLRFLYKYPLLNQLITEPHQWLSVYTAPGKLRAVQHLPPKGQSLVLALQLSPDGHRLAIIHDYRHGHKELQFYKW